MKVIVKRTSTVIIKREQTTTEVIPNQLSPCPYKEKQKKALEKKLRRQFNEWDRARRSPKF